MLYIVCRFLSMWLTYPDDHDRPGGCRWPGEEKEVFFAPPGVRFIKLFSRNPGEGVRLARSQLHVNQVGQALRFCGSHGHWNYLLMGFFKFRFTWWSFSPGRSGQRIAGSGSDPREKNPDLKFTGKSQNFYVIPLPSISLAAAGESVICYV